MIDMPFGSAQGIDNPHIVLCEAEAPYFRAFT